MRGIAGVLAALALAAGALAPTAGAADAGARAAGALAEPKGLWSTGFKAQQSAADCGEWRLDDGFCVANDARNGLEIGVKFQSSAELSIVGIRLYRVDPAAIRASLWDATGTRLAQGVIAASSAKGWHDVTFAAPVTIAPGATYVASYFTPATKYAFSYGYFAGQGRTVGPVTALASTDADPNGVHCYDDAVCGSFPVRGYRNSSYWVTPLWQTPETTGTTPSGPAVDQTGPRVTESVPAGGSRRVKVRASTRVTVQFSEPLLRATLTRKSVRLLQGSASTPVRTRLRYDADRHRVVLTPRTRLRRATTYRVQVTTDVRDVAGNRLDQVPSRTGLQKASWTFRTR